MVCLTASLLLLTNMFLFRSTKERYKFPNCPQSDFALGDKGIAKDFKKKIGLFYSAELFLK